MLKKFKSLYYGNMENSNIYHNNNVYLGKSFFQRFLVVFTIDGVSGIKLWSFTVHFSSIKVWIF